jgi:hypothetical protein
MQSTYGSCIDRIAISRVRDRTNLNAFASQHGALTTNRRDDRDAGHANAITLNMGRCLPHEAITALGTVKTMKGRR